MNLKKIAVTLIFLSVFFLLVFCLPLQTAGPDNNKTDLPSPMESGSDILENRVNQLLKKYHLEK
ncbi:MAG: hypothetical protein AAB019_05470, partial [Planctomycetota bacterium]